MLLLIFLNATMACVVVITVVAVAVAVVQGVYGLPEALKEIEGLKQLLSSHDK